MDCLTIFQCIKIIKIYYKNGDSATAMYRALKGDHFARCAENIAIVSQSVAKHPNVSIPRCRSLELRLSYVTLGHILHLHLHLHPYKVQLTQQLKLADHLQCRRYVEWMLEQTTIFRTKFSSAMKHISHSVRMLITVVFGILRILK